MNLPQIDVLLHGFGTAYYNGTATGYRAGTTTLATWYLDAAGTNPAANPITLDTNGTATLYCADRLKIDVKNSAGVSAAGFPVDNLGFGVYAPDSWVMAKDYATIQDAIDAIAGQTVTLYFEPGAYTVNANTTIPTTIHVEVAKGASITINSGKTLAISGTCRTVAQSFTVTGTLIFAGALLAPTTAIFSGAGTITFTGSGTKEVFPQWFGAVFDGTTDDTTAIQAALDAGTSMVTIDAPTAAIITSITVAANKTLRIIGTLKKKTGSTSAMVILSSGSKLIGTGTIDGNSQTCDAIASSVTTDVVIDGIRVIGNTGKGIAMYSGCTRYQITRNSIYDINGTGIQVEYGGEGTIANNIVERANTPLAATLYSGIVFYGGDAAASDTIGIRGVSITGNVVKNVVGGIWGTLGAQISIAGNYVENCSDVGIDLEGCTDFAVSGNSVREATNSCYSIFYGCSHGTFAGNSGNNTTSNGSAFYATTNGTYTNNYITVTGNNFITKGITIYASPEALRSFSNSAITHNILKSTSNSTIYVLQNANLEIAGNHSTTIGAASGFALQGIVSSVITNNTLFGSSDPSISPISAGGILLYRDSAPYPSQSNIVKNNRVDGYNYSITDSCAADVTQSKNDIEFNHVANIYRPAGITYNGVIANNIDRFTPATAITATTY